MFEIFIILGLGLVALFAYLLSTSKQLFGQLLYGFLMLFFLWATIAIAVVIEPYNAPYVQSNALATNTLYQNLNATQLLIYATSNGTVRGYLGASANSMLVAINSTEVSVGGVGITFLPNTHTSLLVVPYGYYYQYNYTGTTTFVAEGIR